MLPIYLFIYLFVALMSFAFAAILDVSSARWTAVILQLQAQPSPFKYQVTHNLYPSGNAGSRQINWITKCWSDMPVYLCWQAVYYSTTCINTNRGHIENHQGKWLQF